MSASTQSSTGQDDFVGSRTPASPLADIPSWFISLVFHALLLFVVATSLKSCEGLPAGDPDAGMREIGLHVKESNALVERAAKEADNSATFQQPLDNDVQQPLFDENPPAEIQTPRIDQRPNVVGSGGPPPAFSSQTPVEGMTLPNGNFQPMRPGALEKGETSFFGIRDSARQFTYVLDASGSMYGIAFQSAKAELNKSIEALDATQRFQILFYTQTTRIMKLRGAPDGSLVWATSINKTLARQDINNARTSGGTDHMLALKKALRLRPEVIYFLTDADDPLGAADLNDIKQLNKGRARIHCIEFGKFPDLKIDNFLRRLARQNGGTYLYRDVTKFKRK
jgi:Ca-activated chloride channel family protein